MYFKVFFNLILLISLFAFQAGFVSGSSFIFNDLNFLLVILIFILVLSGEEKAFWWALGFGFLLDIYYFNIFGLNLFILPLMVLIAKFLLANFLTNKSIYTFLTLVLFSLLFYELAFLLFYYLLSSVETSFYFEFELRQIFKIFVSKIFVNFLLTLLIFYSLGFINKQFSSVTLSSREK